MEVWEDLVKVALVGTERQALPEEPGEDAVGRLLSQLEGEKEQKLLRACALLTTYRRAGYRAAVAEETLYPPVEAEPLPMIRQEAALDLLVMLRGQHQELLPEWCLLVAEQGKRIPEECLAELLDFGRTHVELRSALLPLLGKRGRWLAGQRPEWKYALQISLFEIENAPEGSVLTSNDPEQVWATGTREERVALLHLLRRTEPARARALVESTWRQDPADERASFLETFKTALSMEDEPLLETALDDRRKEVRVLAQQLLPLLPESRLCLRMWELARELIQWKKPLIGAATISLTLPTECTRAMIRDGIEPKPPSPQVGEKAWWLEQIVARVPLSRWSGEWKSAPDRILAAKRPDDWKNLLRESWTNALQRSSDPQWAAALFRTWIEEHPTSMPAHFAWKEWLTLENFEAGTLQLLELASTRLTYGSPVWALLDQYKTVWSRPFARTFIERLRGLKRDTYQVGARLDDYAPYIPREEMSAFLIYWNELAETNPYLSRKMEGYLAREDFRQEMRQRILA